MAIIGVFDSGIGGLSVANAIKKAFPANIIKFVNDSAHVPYGIKTNEQLLNLSLPLLKSMEDDGCDMIVVACNTLTTTVITEIRSHINVPIVAIEPMVKPAARLTRTKVIAVCATPATLNSKRYKQLKSEFATGIKVLEPDCSNWASLIENNNNDRSQIEETIKEVIEQSADVIVLGCTHYHWIEKDIKSMAAGKASVIQPEEAIIKRVKITLEQLA